MEKTSSGRVTITLGRSGQVVKREASSSEATLPRAGKKRSIRDRLGRSSEDGHYQNGSHSNGSIKRQRGITGTLVSRAMDDELIDKHDLRLKLMRKSASRRARSSDNRKPEDLRDKLKKTARRSNPNLDSQRFMHESKGLGRIPSRRSADDLRKMDSDRDLCSHWANDQIRRRSPNRVLVSSRGFSPRRGGEEAQRRLSSGNFGDVRSVPYTSKGVIDTARPLSNVTFQSSSGFSSGPLKTVAPPRLSHVPPPSNIAPKSSYMVEEQQTVDGLLHSLGLGKYVVIFKAEEVDMTVLRQMGENDLKELGIPMGPRKKILLSLLPRARRQP